MKYICLTLLLLLAAAPTRANLVDGIAAIVGDEIILISELNRSVNQLTRQIERQNGPMPAEARQRLRREALQGLINDRLITDFANRVQIAATPVEVDQAIMGIAEEEGVTVEDIYSAAEQQGLDQESYRRELGSQITRMKVISGSIRARITVSEEEVNSLYMRRYGGLDPGERTRVRHILLPWPIPETPKGKAELLEMADELRKRALSGSNFAELALSFSAAPSAQDGGLTVFKEGDVSGEIAESLKTLEPAGISEPIETVHGLNLFQLIDRFDPAEVDLEEVHDQLYAELVERKTMPEFESWLEELRENRYIKINLPDLQ